MRCFEIRKDDFATTRWVDDAAVAGDGQIVCAIDVAALTSNNVTYALVAERYGYWKYYPAAEGWGRVPVWGFATVTDSHHPQIAAGERIYGYWPIADEVVLTPGAVTARQFSDVSAHRDGLPQVYNNYMRVAADRHYQPEREPIRAVFDPLAGTSYGVAHKLRADGYHGARRVLVTSASSKTGFSIGLYLREFGDDIEVVGLTSARNVEGTQATGGFDRVIAYDGIDTLDPAVPTVIADVAGDGALAARLHGMLGDALTAHVSVGFAHPDAARKVEGLATAKMSLFFLPDYIAGFVARGDKSFLREMVAASARVGDSASAWMELVGASSEAGIAALWQKVLAGQLSPQQAGIIRLGSLR